MKIVYIGTVIPTDILYQFPETSIAANNFQMGILKSFYMDNRLEVYAYSVPAKRSWPANGAALVQKRIVLDSLSSNIIIPRFCNIKFLKEISIRLNLFLELKKLLKQLDKNDDICVLSYNGDGRIGFPIRLLKKKYNFKYTCMVVDPPEYQGTTKRTGLFWRYLYSKTRQSYLKSIKAADSLIVLNKGFINKNAVEKPYIVVEGGVSVDEIVKAHNEPPKIGFSKCDYNIVFTGTLHEHSGIVTLINMFAEAKIENAVLHVFGSGPMTDEVQNFANRYSNIKYYGAVDFNTAISAQHYADLLICPNPINHPINKVAFPSKLIEYLCSKTPIMATKLDSIGKEYGGCIVFYDETIEDFQAKIKTIREMSIEEKERIINKAFLLAQDKKEWRAQSKRIFDFLAGNCYE